MDYWEGMEYLYDLEKEPEKDDSAKNRADLIYNMVIAATRLIPQSKGFTTEFQAKMLKLFPDIANETQADKILKYVYDRAQEARIGQTNFTVGGIPVCISKNDIKEPPPQRQGNTYRTTVNIKALLLILVLLAGLWIFRWDHILTQSLSRHVSYSWEHDRWTGAIMALNIENPSWPYTGKPSLKQYTVKNGVVPVDTATNIWVVLLGVDLALLVFCVVKNREYGD